MGKTNPFSFRRSSSGGTTTRRRKTAKKAGESPLLLSEQSPSPNNEVVSTAKPVAAVAKVKKKAGGARLWMRFDRSGESEVFECDKTTIIKRAGIPARDLRILGPVFSNSSNILGC
ncbi:putative magnesium transporter MRS2 [Helianthus annuus]|nr:putative magnesium transporter MRS2 [Helianthus annuus]